MSRARGVLLASVLAGLGVPLAAVADGGAIITTNGNRVTVRGDLVMPGATRSGLTVTQPVTLPAPGGAKVGGKLAITVTKKGALTLAVRALASVPGVGLVVLAAQLLDEIRVKPAGDGKTLIQDPGQAPSGEGHYCGQIGVYQVCGSSRQAAADAGAAKFGEIAGTCSNGTKPPYWGAVGEGGVGLVWSGSCETGHSPSVVHTFGIGELSGPMCPDFFDSVLGATVVGTVGMDGKCPTGAYTKPLTPDEAAQMRYAFDTFGASTIDYPALLDEALDRGSPLKIPPDSNVTVGNVLPSTVNGKKTTTTNPNGTTTQTAVKWDTTMPKVGLTPMESILDWKKTTTTTTTDTATGQPVGAPTVETETPGEDAASEDGPKTDDDKEEKDPCEGKPDRLGCVDTGEVEDADIEGEERDVSAEAQAGWGAGNGACPAPTVFTTQGQVIEMDNSLICGFMTGIRPFVIGAAGIAAALIFIGAGRSE